MKNGCFLRVFVFLKYADKYWKVKIKTQFSSFGFLILKTIKIETVLQKKF